MNDRPLKEELGQCLLILFLHFAGISLFALAFDTTTHWLTPEYFWVPRQQWLSWVIGMFAGIMVCLGARLGRRPPFVWQFFLKPMVIMACMITVVAAMTFAVSYAAAEQRWMNLYHAEAQIIPANKHSAVTGWETSRHASALSVLFAIGALSFWCWTKRAQIEAKLEKDAQN